MYIHVCILYMYVTICMYMCIVFSSVDKQAKGAYSIMYMYISMSINTFAYTYIYVHTCVHTCTYMYV